jgi:hypothetical protein
MARPGTGLVGAAALIFLSAASCAMSEDYIDFAATNPSPRVLLGRPPEKLEFFTSGPPARPHVDVGIFQVWAGDDGFSRCNTTEHMLGVLRSRAASMGCDAVVVFGITYAKPCQKLQATCLAYTEP